MRESAASSSTPRRAAGTPSSGSKRKSASSPARTASNGTGSTVGGFPTPSKAFFLVAFGLYYTNRRRLLAALISWWAIAKGCHALLASEAFQCRILLLQFTRRWPPCNLDRPDVPQKLPFLFRWLEWLPTRVGLDDLKSFRGIKNVRSIESLRRRKVGAWLVEPQPGVATKTKGLVLYFRGRSGHRGTRSRLRMYERLSAEPLGLHCAAFDGNDDELVSERGQLEDAHAVWAALTRPPFEFEANSVVIWGCALGCCSAANLCLYLMRRGTPPAALILENPTTSLPKLIASRFLFMGERVQRSVERLLKASLHHSFDLEKRIRSICNFGVEVPMLLISTEKDWSAAPAHAQRIADLASALSASKRVRLLSLPVSRQNLTTHPEFNLVLDAFVNQALMDARRGLKRRTISVDYVASPASQSDIAAEDRLFESQNDSAFGL